MSKVHPYRELEREYVTADISLRKLCRKHGISARSSVVPAKKGKWQEKRERYRAQESDAYNARHAARHADRQAHISDKALVAIDEAITKFRQDLRAMKPVRQPDGSTSEEPVMRLMPKGLALLIDRLRMLLERPSAISQHQGLTVSTELSAQALREFIDATRGRAGPSPMEVSPLPRTRRLDD